jgi:hypothetical protein
VNTALLSGVTADETSVVEGPEVEVYWYKEPATQIRELSRHLNRLLSGGLRPSDIVLLSRRRLSNSSLANGLSSVPFPLQEIDNGHPVHQKSIRYSTFAAFKGLEADAVMVIDIDDLTSQTARGGLYVGASRARVLLALFISEAVRPDYEKLAMDFGRRLTEVRNHPVV